MRHDTREPRQSDPAKSELDGAAPHARPRQEPVRADATAEAQARLAAIVESSDDAIVSKSLDGIITSWNAAAERLLGYTEAEIVGRSILTIIPPEFQDEEPVILQRIADGQRIAHYETQRLRKDGTRLIVSLSISPVRDASGRVVGAAKILRDITTEKKIEAGRGLLSDISAILTTTLDQDVIAERVAQLSVPVLADWCIVDVMSESAASRRTVVRPGAAHADRALQPVLDELRRRYPPDIDRPTLAGPVVETGEPILVADVPDARIDEVARDPEHAALIRRLGLRSYMVVPLTVGGRSLGALSFLSAQRRYDRIDISLAEQVAQRAALALENARLFRDLERREDEQRLLAAAGVLLSSSHGTHAIFSAVASVIVPKIADWLAIQLSGDEDIDVPAITIRQDSTHRSWVEDYNRSHPQTPRNRSAIIADPGRSELYSTISDEALRAITPGAEQREIILGLGTKSLIVVPIVARNHFFGAMMLGIGESGRSYDAPDLRLAEELARRAASALENSMLLNESTRAAERTARLQAVTAGLAQAISVDEVANTVVRQGIAALQAKNGVLCLVCEGGKELEIVHAIGLPAETAAEWRRFAVDGRVPLAEAVRTRRPMFLGSRVDVQANYPSLRAANERAATESWIALPLISNGEVLGGLGFGFAERRGFDDGDRALAHALSQQCAQALERSRLLNSERVERENAQRAADRTARLQSVTAALAAAVSTDDVVTATLHEGLPAVGASGGVILRLSDDGGEVNRIWAVGYPEDRLETFRQMALVHAFPPRDVVRTREPIFIENERTWLERYEPPGPGMTVAPAAAALPLLVGERLVGVMVLRFPTPRDFAPDDRAHILSIGSQCAQALERARLHEAASEARETERFLADVGSALAESLDYQTTLRRIAELPVPRVVDWCIVYLLDGDAIRRVATAATDASVSEMVADAEHRYPMSLQSDGAITRVVKQGTEVVISQMTEDILQRMAIDPTHASLLRRFGYRSAIVVPMRVRGAIIAALLFGTGPSKRKLGERDLDVARRFADRAALAIDQARLLRAEQQARRDAEDANRSKGQFLATMSHELRTPLNAISGHIQLIELGLHGPVSEPQRAALGRVSRAQERLLGLINDILNFARLESGRVEYHITPVSVADVIGEVVALMEPQFSERGLVLDVRQHVPDEVGAAVIVSVDREKLMQVLLNLLSNAAKFTETGGVTLEVVSGATGANTVLIRVTDTGVGIPADKLQTIFEPFVQLGRSLTSTPMGTGLGLSISRDLARGMGGDLSVESTLGVGSTFTLTLQRG